MGHAYFYFHTVPQSLIVNTRKYSEIPRFWSRLQKIPPNLPISPTIQHVIKRVFTLRKRATILLVILSIYFTKTRKIYFTTRFPIFTTRFPIFTTRFSILLHDFLFLLHDFLFLLHDFLFLLHEIISLLLMMTFYYTISYFYYTYFHFTTHDDILQHMMTNG